MIYIFPPPRCLLIKAYQKLSNNNYNSIFLLRLSPLIYQIQLIYCAVAHRTYSAGLERGGWEGDGPQALRLLPLPGKHQGPDNP